MKKTKYTPGPWKLILPIEEPEGKETEQGGQIAVQMGDRITSPGNFTVGNEVILDENCCPNDNLLAQANARLIAAAPQLLAALEYVEKNAKEDSPAMWAMVARIIKKAKGF